MNISEFQEIIEPIFLFILPYLELAWDIVKKWYWIALPFFLWKYAVFYWIWWRQQIWDSKQSNILLEIKIPKENPKPMRAMETVLSGLWQIHAPPNWIEKWWDGQFLLSYSFEVAAIDGVPHFLIRCPKTVKNIVESHIYSQFPEAEIFEVEDYTKKVPQNIPDGNWDFWATDYKLNRPNPYPIKTFRDFETEREAKEEKRIDPMSSLLETMAKLKKGEQLWVQIKAKPILDPDVSWVSQGKEIINNLVYRDAPKKKKFFLWELIELVVSGPSPKEEKPKESLPPEMKLTPGEKDVLTGIERKIGKLGYDVHIRYIYLGNKEAFFKPNLRLAMSYFTNFVTDNLNAPVPDSNTMTKVRKKWYDPFIFPKRRLYLKKRISFRKYVNRLSYYFPQPGGTFVLNTEELATIFHFPSKILSPASLLPRVEAKKGEAPIDLPTEDIEK